METVNSVFVFLRSNKLTHSHQLDVCVGGCRILWCRYLENTAWNKINGFGLIIHAGIHHNTYALYLYTCIVNSWCTSTNYWAYLPLMCTLYCSLQRSWIVLHPVEWHATSALNGQSEVYPLQKLGLSQYTKTPSQSCQQYLFGKINAVIIIVNIQ